VPLVVRWSMPQVCPKGESPGRYGRYAIRIDTNRPGVYRWLITMDGRSVRKGSLPAYHCCAWDGHPGSDRRA
jgi:hypothetical protein